MIYEIASRVYSADGRIVAHVIDNEFHVNPNNYFRMERRDRHTLLVYDQRARLVLSVRYLNPLAIKLLGVFNYPGRLPVIIGEHQTLIAGNRFSRYCFGNSRIDISIQ